MDIDEFLESEIGKGKDSSSKQAATPATTGEFLSNKTIEEQIQQIKELIRQRKFGDAEQIYLLVKSHYASLEKKQSEERKTLHRSLTEVNKELIDSLTQMKAEIEKKGSVIGQLILKAKEFIMQGDMYKANKIYLEIREMFKTMPEAFTEKKAELENEIVIFYSHLVREFNKQTLSKIVERGRQIELHILTALEFLNQGNLDAAKKEYEVIYQLYTALPDGFIYEKTMIYNQILALHKLAETGVKTEDARRELASMKATLATIKPQSQQPVEKKQEKFVAVKTEVNPVVTPAATQGKKGIFSFLKKQKKEAAGVAVPNIEQKIKLKPDATNAAFDKLDSPPLPSM